MSGKPVIMLAITGNRIMKNRLYATLVLVSALSLLSTARSQTLNLNAPGLLDAYRRAQLLGQMDSSISFTILPINLKAVKFKTTDDSDSVYPIYSLLKPFEGYTIKKGKGSLQILPITWNQQFNTHHPEGFNDGAMIPARGYQTLVSAGVFAKYEPLSIQLLPELVYAQNKEYLGFSIHKNDLLWAHYYSLYYNRIDLPERFGVNSYQKASWGQSSIRLTFNAISIGLSSENLWWGPGKKNSLLMSNTAPGFKHLTLNTIRPVKTFLGSFEGQLIAGRLESSGFDPPGKEREYLEKKIFVPKPDDWRYINAGILTYRPKWIPNLFVGVSRAFYLYNHDLGKKFSDYLPIITPFQKKNADNSAGDGEDGKKRDQLSSVFAKWLFVKAHAEAYFEFGRNDHSWDLRDFLLTPGHSRAYTFGFLRLLPLNRSKKSDLIQLNIEFTQLESNFITRYRPSPTWYVHVKASGGYTHDGQILGAGIGPGSNMQSLDISWVRYLKLAGFRFERIVRNNDFNNYVINDPKGHWIDLGLSAFTQWNFNHLLLNAKIKGIQSLNYQHAAKSVYINSKGEPTNLNALNFQMQIGASYLFK